MNKLFTSFFVALVSFAAPLAWPSAASAAGGAPLPTRLAGADRFLTAVEISKWSFPAPDTAPTVYLYNSDNPVDALAAIPLTDVHPDTRGPLLPVKHGTELTQAVFDEINRVTCDTCVITILGGTASVSQSVQDFLSNGSYFIDRISGETRFETAAAIAGRVRAAMAPEVPDLFIVNSSAYVDALAVGPIAGSFDSEFTPQSFAGGVVLLTYKDSTPMATTDFIDGQAGGWINIVGGSAVVSEAVAKSLSARHWDGNETYFERFDGASRFHTARIIGDLFFQRGSLSYDHAFGVANGLTIADALPGGALMAKYTMPLLLTAGENLNCDTARFIEDDLGQTKDTYVFGGTTVVTQTAYDQITALLDGLTTASNLGC